MPRLHFLPSPAPAADLLADFLCSPVAMRGDRFCAFVRELHGATGRLAHSPSERLIRNSLRADAGTEDGGAEDPCMPWEEPIYSVANGIATVDVCGPLIKGYDAFTCWYYGVMSTDRLQAAVTELIARADVFAVVFRFNSPGGMATGTPETADMIVALGQVKATIGFTSDMAASAAYWMLAACNTIVPTRSATLGSIGTYLALYDYSEYLTELGIKLELFRAGMFKGIGVIGKTLTEEEKAFLQGMVNRINSSFTGFVQSRRPGVKESTMQGQWFDGAQAVSLGLADAVVGSQAEVITHLAAARGQ